eukprot:748100-Hanusia_phi.AAC.1
MDKMMSNEQTTMKRMRILRIGRRRGMKDPCRKLERPRMRRTFRGEETKRGSVWRRCKEGLQRHVTQDGAQTWKVSSLTCSLTCSYAGVGKTSLMHLICEGEELRRPRSTVGCAIHMKVNSGGIPSPP